MCTVSSNVALDRTQHGFYIMNVNNKFIHKTHFKLNTNPCPRVSCYSIRRLGEGLRTPNTLPQETGTQKTGLAFIYRRPLMPLFTSPCLLHSFSGRTIFPTHPDLPTFQPRFERCRQTWLQDCALSLSPATSTERIRIRDLWIDDLYGQHTFFDIVYSYSHQMTRIELNLLI